MYIKRNTEARSRNHCYRGKAVLHIMSACRYSCLRHPACNAHWSYYIVIYGLSSSSQTIFGRGGIEHKMRDFIFSKTSVRNIHSKKNSASYYHKRTYAFTYVFLSDFNETGFLKTFSKNPHMSNLIKNRSLRAKMFHHFSQFYESA